MLKLVLIDNTDDCVSYDYYPENNGNYGTLTMAKKSGEIEIVKVADNDGFHIYLGHAISQLESYYMNKKYVEHDVVAWY